MSIVSPDFLEEWLEFFQMFHAYMGSLKRALSEWPEEHDAQKEKDE